jgi:hypothetical protein
MKGALYIVPADKSVPVERREISAPPSGADLHEIVGGYIEVVPGFNSIEAVGIFPCVAFCNEDGKRLTPTAPNARATTMWHFALKRSGHPGLVLTAAQGGGLADYLVGNIAVITGDAELMEAL